MRGKLMDRFEFDSIVVVVVDSFFGILFDENAVVYLT
jgi:hypothetical protein